MSTQLLPRRPDVPLNQRTYSDVLDDLRTIVKGIDHLFETAARTSDAGARYVAFEGGHEMLGRALDLSRALHRSADHTAETFPDLETPFGRTGEVNDTIGGLHFYCRTCGFGCDNPNHGHAQDSCVVGHGEDQIISALNHYHTTDVCSPGGGRR